MSTRIRSAVASAIGVLLTGSLLTLTAMGQEQDTDMPKKHAACEHMKGKDQMDCEKRLKDMDKKNESESTTIPTDEDKRPPDYPPSN